MARKSDIQYIRLYIDGNAARQYELPPQPQKKTRQRPRPHRQKKIVLHVDFVAMAGMLVAGVMLIMIIIWHLIWQCFPVPIRCSGNRPVPVVFRVYLRNGPVCCM